MREINWSEFILIIYMYVLLSLLDNLKKNNSKNISLNKIIRV